MELFYYIVLVLIISQLLFLVQAFNNYRYALKKYRKVRWYRPQTVLLIPCKGLDSAFEKNIASFYNQDYENYSLWFVVDEESDPAYTKLCELKDQLSETSKAKDIKVLVAGKGTECSQKNHNLLYCYERISDDIDVLAFADSDICVHPNWLSHLVYDLRKSSKGVTSGYRT